MHGIFYNSRDDEIVVPVALGGAVLTLPGGASGGDPPLRVVQGPSTEIVQPDTLYVDVAHEEMSSCGDALRELGIGQLVGEDERAGHPAGQECAEHRRAGLRRREHDRRKRRRAEEDNRG